MARGLGGWDGAVGGVERRSLLRAFETIGLATLAALVVVLTITEARRRGDLAIDFEGVAPEIRGLTQGVDPYLIDKVGEGGHYLWTITAGWLLSPLAWLPHGELVVVGLAVVSLVAAAVLLGVRDWRLVAIALAWPATVNAIQTANITFLVVLFLAAGWFDRGRTRSGLWIGLAVCVKLFAWPALVWLAATRRWRALGVALAVQVVGVLITLPYISLRDYVAFELEVERVLSSQALTLNALLQDLGAAPTLARAVTLAVGLAILWRGRRDLGWVVVAMLGGIL